MMDDPSAELRVALVTGAASGIGRATAALLAARGFRVALLDRDEPGVLAAAAAAAVAGGAEAVRPYPCDVTVTATVDSAARDVVERWGRLDAVAACAGIAVFGDITETTEVDWNRALDINAGGVFRVAKATIPHLRKSRGAFVAVASDAGITGAQGFTAYAASKHAVVGLIRCMAVDHGAEGVRSNVVCPGFVDTPMTERAFAQYPSDEDFYRQAVPLGRFARPEEVAEVIHHLLSKQASYTNGLVYSIDGGSTAGYHAGRNTEQR